jgi:hypothetical protein
VNVYRVEAKVVGDGMLNLKNLPFQEGDEVEVIIRALRQAKNGKDYPLRGKPVRYIEPFKSVDEDQWEALQ